MAHILSQAEFITAPEKAGRGVPCFSRALDLKRGVSIKQATLHLSALGAYAAAIDGQPVGDYGDQANFLAGTSEKNLSYGGFYGGDEGEVIFSTGTTDRGSLLVIGDSFDNAILKLLASHYDTLYSVDLRYYAHSMGQPFDLTAYTQAHGITNVLLLGNIDYFSQDTFDPEG